MKKLVIPFAVIAFSCTLAACSNIFTYVRHDESQGNIQCNGETGLKRDGTCNATISNPEK